MAQGSNLSTGPRRRAVIQALVVTFLWSTSWVLIKAGLQDMPALTFAGLRYSLAFLCLLPFALQGRYIALLGTLPRQDWGRLILLGLLFVALTQGAQFLALAYLPTATVNLLLSFTPIIVALLGITVLGERMTGAQWGGVASCAVGAVVYFHPFSLPTDRATGLVIAIIGVLVNAVSSILGRHINRQANIPPLVVTSVSIGVGAVALLVSGVLIQGMPNLQWRSWAIIIWLAVVSTAFAFTLWNQALRTLSAVESSIINSTMLVQVAVLAWLFLGEQLTWKEAIGMALVGLGALIVQTYRSPAGEPTADA